jgi:probable rRNA maturation factor
VSAARRKPAKRTARGRIEVHIGSRTIGITAPAIRRAVRAALADRVIESVSVAVVDDKTIAELHERYMQDSRPTDVLTFDLRDEPASERIEGEIVLSAQTAGKVARNLRLSERQEVLRYVIHGALHLAGWDDRTTGQRAKMRQEEDRVLGVINL